MVKWKISAVALAALALATPAAAAAAPAALAATPAVGSGATTNLTPVQYRRYHHYHRGGRFGRGLGIGLGVGILGAIIANEAYRPRPGYYYDDYAYDGPYYEPSSFAGDPRNLCAQNFRSFEWNTGL
jgi:hypothetical protein